MSLTRIREEEDGSQTLFRLHNFGRPRPFRAEVTFESVDEMRDWNRRGRIIGIRMSDSPSDGRQPQRNIVGVGDIEGLSQLVLEPLLLHITITARLDLL